MPSLKSLSKSRCICDAQLSVFERFDNEKAFWSLACWLWLASRGRRLGSRVFQYLGINCIADLRSQTFSAPQSLTHISWHHQHWWGIQNAKFGPTLAYWGHLVANFRIFWCNFTGLFSAVAYQNWLIWGMPQSFSNDTWIWISDCWWCHTFYLGRDDGLLAVFVPEDQ